jgi:hypothetical protein
MRVLVSPLNDPSDRMRTMTVRFQGGFELTVCV